MGVNCLFVDHSHIPDEREGKLFGRLRDLRVLELVADKKQELIFRFSPTVDEALNVAEMGWRLGLFHVSNSDWERIVRETNGSHSVCVRISSQRGLDSKFDRERPLAVTVGKPIGCLQLEDLSALSSADVTVDDLVRLGLLDSPKVDEACALWILIAAELARCSAEWPNPPASLLDAGWTPLTLPQWRHHDENWSNPVGFSNLVMALSESSAAKRHLQQLNSVSDVSKRRKLAEDAFGALSDELRIART